MVSKSSQHNGYRCGWTFREIRKLEIANDGMFKVVEIQKITSK